MPLPAKNQSHFYRPPWRRFVSAYWFELLVPGMAVTSVVIGVKQYRNFAKASGPPQIDSLRPALIAAMVAIGIFAATKIFEIVAQRAGRRASLRNLVVGIFAEIHYNQTTTMAFLQDGDVEGMLEYVRADPANTPHLNATHHTRFYEGNVQDLASLDHRFVPMLIEVYDALATIEAEAVGLRSETFKKISRQGREQVIRDLWATFELVRDSASYTLEAMEHFYSPKWFKAVTFSRVAEHALEPP